MERKTWNEFRKAGMLWWINRILHTFGWSIVIETGDTHADIYPARTTWLGFDEKTNDEMLAAFKAHTTGAGTRPIDKAIEWMGGNVWAAGVPADVVIADLLNELRRLARESAPCLQTKPLTREQIAAGLDADDDDDVTLIASWMAIGGSQCRVTLKHGMLEVQERRPVSGRPEYPWGGWYPVCGWKQNQSETPTCSLNS